MFWPLSCALLEAGVSSRMVATAATVSAARPRVVVDTNTPIHRRNDVDSKRATARSVVPAHRARLSGRRRWPPASKALVRTRLGGAAGAGDDPPTPATTP